MVKIAESMWRLRRATRCESGSVREASLYSDHRNEEHLIPGLLSDISVLNAAEEQLRNSGTLSEKLYEHTAPLVEEERRKRIQSKEENAACAEIVDRELFLNCIASRKQMLELLYDGTLRISQRRWEACFDQNALPPAADTDRLLRYEERMYRQLDWALQRLLESQARRNRGQPVVSAALSTTGSQADLTKQSQ